ncbi:uncharacterized protein LOC132194686 [Neocloeon triangulifer]|uniref:uncharacterized protein LOC132194686 n=1 Tax=Neocloeon triangulifer TaxID=2078957 RepID=UPI00286F5006|nr:uncharacterized protein LOC132194686 [Neocloeon triangulifer]
MEGDEYADFLLNYQQQMNNFVLQTGIALAVTLSNQNTKNRSVGVHEINKKRNEKGFYHNLYQELRVHPQRFFKFFRMSVKQFDFLCELIRPHLVQKDVFTHRPFPTDMRVAVTLRFLAAGDSTHTLACAFRIGDSTCRQIVAETCAAITSALMPQYIKAPTKEEYKVIAKEFEDRWNLPNCIGAVDGKHVVMKCPPNSGSTFFNYKKQFSVNLFAVCDANYCFTIAEVGYVGVLSDAGVFRLSPFGQSILNETHPIPEAGLLPKAKNDQNCNFFFVGDEAFGLRTDFLIPYGKGLLSVEDELLSYERRVFNYRLSRARRVIENTFGILAARWRIFHRTIEAHPENACLFVQACVCLHNFLMKTKERSGVRVPPGYFGDVYKRGELSVPGAWRKSIEGSKLVDLPMRSSRTPITEARVQRDMLARYLTYDYALPYQEKYVNRGVQRAEEALKTVASRK